MARSLWHIDTHTTQIKTVDRLSDSGIGLHVQSLYSLISLGTELRVARGEVPVTMYDYMRVPRMEGEFIFPVKYGYSLVGEMAGTGAICHLLHPHQSECLVDPDTCFEVPVGIPPKRATLASNLETALTGVWDGDVKPGERIAVVGFGMVGSLIARIASSIPGTQVKIVEINNIRKGYAEKFGCSLLEDPGDAREPFDVAFHTSGTQEGLQTALDLVGLEGRVVEMSWYGDQSVQLNLGGEFHVLRKYIISSQVGRIPGRMQARWDHHRRKKAVFEILRNPEYDQHITHEITLEEAAELFNSSRKKSPDGLGYCIRY